MDEFVFPSALRLWLLIFDFELFTVMAAFCLEFLFLFKFFKHNFLVVILRLELLLYTAELMHQRFHFVDSIVMMENPVESCPSVIRFGIFRRLACN